MCNGDDDNLEIIKKDIILLFDVGGTILLLGTKQEAPEILPVKICAV